MPADDRFSVRPPHQAEVGELTAILAAMERGYDAEVMDDEAAEAAERLLGGRTPARCLVAVPLEAPPEVPLAAPLAAPAGEPGPAGRFLGIALFAPLFPGARYSDVMHLKSLFVIPELRGRGIGRALVAAVARAAIDAGCDRMEWVTERGNAAARAAFKAMGTKEGDGVTYRAGPQALIRLAATGHADPRGKRRARHPAEG